MVPWPASSYKRASLNSFVFGRSNAHVIIDVTKSFFSFAASTHATSYLTDDSDYSFTEVNSTRSIVLVPSANDEQSRKDYWRSLRKHLVNPNVDIKIRDLAYTFSERRTHHFYRGYVTTKSLDFNEDQLVVRKRRGNVPEIGFVLTGQAAQWSSMGKLVATIVHKA